MKKEPKVIKMDLPDVSDIPGQENFKVEKLGPDTPSSADEEGEGVLDDDPDTDLSDDSNVSDTERRLLDEAANEDPAYEDETRMHEAEVDQRDEDGDPLNEDESLDVPGSEADDEEEATGAEDEENNDYSIDKNDD
ncbi:hypothetical protein [Chitinophaga sp. CB10]|uniref:hypothetical protein n=1 Tax=Chitinophaga sp. CB10 TaxID=1891659 RepID=UPI0025B86442|nr:hypothetical protein [Chitinophaga sp. CB10]